MQSARKEFAKKSCAYFLNLSAHCVAVGKKSLRRLEFSNLEQNCVTTPLNSTTKASVSLDARRIQFTMMPSQYDDTR